MGSVTSKPQEIANFAQIFTQPVSELPGVGSKRVEALERLGIRTVGDLLYHLPRDYQDRRALSDAASLCEGDDATLFAEVREIRLQRLRGRKKLVVATLADETGTVGATWFGQAHLVRLLQPGSRGYFTGRVGRYKGLNLQNPAYELVSGEDGPSIHADRIVPIYPAAEGVSQRMLRQWAADALDRLPRDMPDPLPEDVRQRLGLPDLAAALRTAHFPTEQSRAKEARDRLAFEELFGLQLGVLQQRILRHEGEQGVQHVTDGPRLEALRDSLPYALTHAQARAVSEILGDMASPHPMARLLQGDVGCGKTAVALHAVAAAVDGGYQAAVMAPTEVLAGQHFLNMHEALTPLGIEVALLTGSTRDSAITRQELASGAIPVVVGTHALVQDTTAFHSLGLVIVDEQHRFGIVHRSALEDKGAAPDLLHMTATPIPRTLTLTLYGSMDLTIIDEMPPGRRPVKTRRLPPDKEPGLMDYIVRQAEAGFQTYYVCPLIEESEKSELTSVTQRYEELAHGPLASVRTALLHGRMPPAEKEEVIRRFRKGEVDVLFSTTVIEVGVDVPAATTMVIEDAAGFGLTQLHQLRGRIGRGAEQAYCFLLGQASTEEGKKRLEVLRQTESGFDIAEADLSLRGPGELQGLRQAGLDELRVVSLLGDQRWLELARREAQDILSRDPRLEAPEHALLAERAKRYQDLAL